jgi:hypothetical protein
MTNRKMIKTLIDSETLIDSHIVLTYDCWYCFLVFNISASHALEMTIHFYYPTLELFCLLTYPLPSTPQNFVYPTLFSSMPPQAKNNHRSLIYTEANLASFARGGGGFPEGVHCYGAFWPGTFFAI